MATTEVHELLRGVWTNATAWLVGRYVIMPDHMHLFAAAADPGIAYENWVRYWKSQFTKQHQTPGHRWQSDHWETRVRSATSYEEKWDYVLHNPVRKNLVLRPEDWPYQGELNELRWD